MRLLGLTCGSPMGNTEVLVREALYAAEEVGVEIAMIRLMDLDLEPCTGCVSCVESLMKGGAGCVLKDDFPFLDEQFMQSDGIILGAPVYVLGPNGQLKIMADRMGPSHDAAWRLMAKTIREKTGRTAGKGPDERSFKQRVAGLISVGGASTPHWASMGIPLMHFVTFPSHVQVIDQMQHLGTTAVGNIVLTPEKFERARVLGRNVAEAMLKPAEERVWKGDEQGTCPVCHNNLLTVTAHNPVECSICGIAGTLSVDGDRITVTFSEEEQARSRLAMAGKHEHWVEVSTALQTMLARPDLPEIPARLGAYEARPLRVLAPEGVGRKPERRMIKSLVLHDIPLDAIARMERWYYRDHAPEIVRRYGPWLARHESYLPVPAPTDALAYGTYDWRLTEGWWREVPAPGAQGALSFTPPPVVPTVATCFVPAQPTEDFVGSERVPADGASLRWVVFLRFPEGVTEEEGERWFGEVFAAEVAGCADVRRAFSYRTVREFIGLPGTWAPGTAPPLETLRLGWHRVLELWFDDFSAWRRTVVGPRAAFTAPHWATADTFPFVQPYADFAGTFVLERPNDEFLRDVRAYMP